MVHVDYKLKTLYQDDGDYMKVELYEYDHKHEEDQIEAVLAAIAPVIKSISLLPHSAKGVYKQMPEEGMTQEEYEERLRKIGNIDWSKFSGGSDGQCEKYCEGDSCEISFNKKV